MTLDCVTPDPSNSPHERYDTSRIAVRHEQPDNATTTAGIAAGLPGAVMEGNSRPKRALLAYCALADRLRVPGAAGITQALTPFLAEVCRSFAGELFDAQKFSNAVSERFGFRVPRLAALGLAEQLADEGLLEEIAGHSNRSAVYRYTRATQPQDPLPPHVTEQQIEKLLASFAEFCRADDRIAHLDDATLHSAFLDRLLNVDSMRLLSKREGSAAAKRTAKTLVLGREPAAEIPDRQDPVELHLDFLVSQFLLDLQQSDAAAFDQVSDVAFANMAAEAIACFQEPQDSRSLEGLTVLLDSPLLLDALGVNEEYMEYGRELLEAVRSSGAKAAVLDHCVAEAENTVAAQLAHLRSGINRFGHAAGTTARPDLLAALKDSIAERAEKRLGVTVHRDPELNLARRAQTAVGDIQAAMTEQMHAWRNGDARDHDQKSVWSMLSIRNTLEPCPKICDAQWLLLTRNTALVSIANKAWATWLKGSTKHSAYHIEKWAPVAMSDKQFAGYIWSRSGGQVGAAISRARLLAHCSAAVRPRADVKAKAYNLVLELSGKEEADDLAALLEDREGARALMRATRGDPEDVTATRIAYIIDQVKLAAGEYAAAAVRDQASREREALEAAHQKAVADERKAAEERAARAAQTQIDLDRHAHEEEKRALRESLRASERAERARQRQVLSRAFKAGCRLFRLLRWGFVLVLGALSGGVTYWAGEFPMLALAAAALTSMGAWFVPDLFNAPFSWLSMKLLRIEAKRLDLDIQIPAVAPDFRERSWSALDGTPDSRPLQSEPVSAA